jgi:hypothetical protein
MYLYSACLLELAIISLNSINRLVFKLEIQCVFF